MCGLIGGSMDGRVNGSMSIWEGEVTDRYILIDE